jgi:hypothetical protein
VGHDVVEPGARGLGERLEVALPHALGRLAAAPDVPLAVHVDGVAADEVHRADDVVPVARLEQVGDPVLAPGHEVGLDAQPQVRLLADEGAVVVEVADGVAAPERVVGDVQRGGEPVHVLGDAELLDPALRGHVAVALGVGGGEEALGRVLQRVRPQVDVVVGQQ